MQSIRHRQSSLVRHPLSDVTRQRRAGFTLVELLVVISIISILMAILMPALARVNLQMLRLANMNNQRQIVCAVNEFAVDNDNRYPESVATVGFGDFWGWQEPTMITAFRQRSRGTHRSMSAYLSSYIDNSEVLYCPCAPEEYPHLQDAWDAGDHWDNPDSDPIPDPVMGTYCFYWNYIGYLPETGKLFKGPRFLMGGQGQSELVVSDYLGYGHWRSPQAFGSCEPIPGGQVTPGTSVSSAFWSIAKDPSDIGSLGIRLQAGYTDGHVERFKPADTVPMRVSLTGDGLSPYPPGVGPGEFFLPTAALH